MASYQARQRDPLLDQGTQAMLEKRGRELFGIALIGLGLAFALMLGSYSPDDPGWMVATDAPAGEVVDLQVVPALGEAQVVGEVVHPVVGDEEVADGGVDVVASGLQLGDARAGADAFTVDRITPVATALAFVRGVVDRTCRWAGGRLAMGGQPG